MNQRRSAYVEPTHEPNGLVLRQVLDLEDSKVDIVALRVVRHRDEHLAASLHVEVLATLQLQRHVALLIVVVDEIAGGQAVDGLTKDRVPVVAVKCEDLNKGRGRCEETRLPYR